MIYGRVWSPDRISNQDLLLHDESTILKQAVSPFLAFRIAALKYGVDALEALNGFDEGLQSL